MSFGEWKEVKLGEVANVLSGYAFKSDDFCDNGIPVIKIKNISPPYVSLDDVQYVSKELSEEKSRYKLRYNDVLISLTGSNVNQFASAVGKVGRIKINKPMMLNQRVGKFEILNQSVFNLDFLYYFISTEEMHYKLAINAGGAANQANISPGMIKNIDLPCPPIDEQKSIANTLSCLDDKIELNNRITKTLEEMAQAIFKSWFVDFEPFQDVGFEDSEMGRIPKGWRVADFEEVFNFQEGPGIRNWQYVTENGTKFINIRCIQNNDLQLSTANMISDEEAKGKYSHFMLEEWDVVVSSSGTLGRYAIVRKEHLPLCLNTSVIRFSPRLRFEYFSFIFGYLTSSEFYDHLITKACGSVQANFGPMHLRQIKLILPTEEIMLQYHKNVFPLIKRCIQVRSENQTLISLRNSLLPKLMSGEIRVPIEEVQ